MKMSFSGCLPILPGRIAFQISMPTYNIKVYLPIYISDFSCNRALHAFTIPLSPLPSYYGQRCLKSEVEFDIFDDFSSHICLFGIFDKTFQI